MTVTTNGKATTYVYDNMGRRTSVTLPGSRTVTYTYKNTGELATVDGAETYKQSYDYDSQGRMSTLSTYKTPTVPQNTTWAYNNRGFMTSKTYADGKGTTYTYSDDGELATRVWDRGITTTYSYDNAGRQTGIDYSDTTPDITYTYDWMGNPATVTDAEGTRTFTYNYTTSGHPGLASVTVPGIVASIDYTYDAYGRRTAMSLMKNSSAVLTNNYGYDTTSGKLNKIDDGTYSANYTYADGTGLITQNQIKLESTSAVVTTHNRTYDTRLNNYHLLNTSNTTGATTRTYSYLYNDKDQRTKLTLADGTYWEYTYDDKGQVTGGVKKNAAGNLIAGQYFGYSYDGIGNRVSAETKLAALKLTYTTNNVNQYTAVNTPGIVPVLGEADADTTVQAVRTDASNLTDGKQKTIPARSGKYFSGAFTGIDNSSAAQTIPYDVYAIKDETTTQQIQKASSSYTVPKAVTSPTYDTDENMTSDGEWTYTWNGENRKIAAEKSDMKLEFVYDYMGRRVSKKVYTGSTGNWTLSTHQKFVYNGFKQIAEYNASDVLQKTYTWQPVDLDVPLWVNDNNTYYFYIVDGNKNVRAMVDTSGNEVAQYDYNPFGKVTASLGAYKDTNKYRFSSEYHDDETKLVYYNFRYYSPSLGRWSKRDPIGEHGGFNLYGMTGNNPIDKWDRLGLTACPCKCKSGMKDLNSDINNYINGIISSSKGNMDKVFKKLIPSTAFVRRYGMKVPLSNLTGIEDWLYRNHKSNMEGVYNDFNRASKAPCMRLCGECVGTDKIGHFFEEGKLYHDIKKMTGNKKYAEGLGEWLEGKVPKDPAVVSWLKKTIIPSFTWSGGKLSNVKVNNLFGNFGDLNYAANKQPVGMADLAANSAGMSFWDELEKSGGKMKFDICKYVNSNWDENKNPNVASDRKP